MHQAAVFWVVSNPVQKLESEITFDPAQGS